MKRRVLEHRTPLSGLSAWMDDAFLTTLTAGGMIPLNEMNNAVLATREFACAVNSHIFAAN